MAVAGFVVVLVLGQLAGIAGVAAAQSSVITGFSYSGDGSVDTGRDVLYLWQSSSHTFDVVIETGSTWREVEVCLHTSNTNQAEPDPISCTSQQIPSSSTVTATVSVSSWPANATGQQTATVTVSDGGGVIDQSTLSLTVLEKDGDLDGDSVANQREVSSGTRIDIQDTDEDGLLDGEELDTHGTNPTQGDTDGDGLDDFHEVNTSQTDPTKADTDGDGLTDDLEVNEYETNPNTADSDRDGLNDKEEVDSYQTDPMEADSDGDGLADAAEVSDYSTDPNTQDTDVDGLADGIEVHVHGTDPTKSDTDGDGLTDDAEINRHRTDPTAADSDGDELDDGPELEIYDTNPNKADSDSDGLDDGAEVQRGSDPTVPNENPRGGPGGLLLPERAPVLGVALGGLLLVVGAAALYYRPDALGRITGRSSAGSGGTPEDESTDLSEQQPPPATVLSKQEQVLKILEENGDQIRQSEIVTRTGWSKSTVSRTLSKMEESGTISKIDVGRGNVITRAGSEPENAGSPYD